MTCKLHARSTDLVLHQTNVPTNSVSKKKKKKNAKACLYKEPQKVIILEGPLHDPALYRDSLSLSQAFMARKAQRQFRKGWRGTDQSLNISKAKWVTSKKEKKSASNWHSWEHHSTAHI